uniref:Uncharacterized protein n=1 Tax=Chromera velia CCMP2878 TaxID=1169474 RepID=A0A0G4FHY9_9ALVE|eukprot:Cvel_17044.t1-p1 / transcript=Cvel_17044.t1 / gene=Cvel_17044 / organism=Chromera_velia_CCMP2878 / gene_product=hypothetical protein / transcript_product=hypothetical protein / location=Cvel_scaffold1342:6838-8385(-) / protein_length=516 / sequence_SO=supercontig / SO=protein_coding / is_pseudo=false
MRAARNRARYEKKKRIRRIKQEKERALRYSDGDAECPTVEEEEGGVEEEDGQREEEEECGGEEGVPCGSCREEEVEVSEDEEEGTEEYGEMLASCDCSHTPPHETCAELSKKPNGEEDSHDHSRFHSLSTALPPDICSSRHDTVKSTMAAPLLSTPGTTAPPLPVRRQRPTVSQGGGGETEESDNLLMRGLVLDVPRGSRDEEVPQHPLHQVCYAHTVGVVIQPGARAAEFVRGFAAPAALPPPLMVPPSFSVLASAWDQSRPARDPSSTQSAAAAAAAGRQVPVQAVQMQQRSPLLPTAPPAQVQSVEVSPPILPSPLLARVGAVGVGTDGGEFHGEMDRRRAYSLAGEGGAARRVVGGAHAFSAASPQVGLLGSGSGRAATAPFSPLFSPFGSRTRGDGIFPTPPPTAPTIRVSQTDASRPAPLSPDAERRSEGQGGGGTRSSGGVGSVSGGGCGSNGHRERLRARRRVGGDQGGTVREQSSSHSSSCSASSSPCCSAPSSSLAAGDYCDSPHE